MAFSVYFHGHDPEAVLNTRNYGRRPILHQWPIPDVVLDELRVITRKKRIGMGVMFERAFNDITRGSRYITTSALVDFHAKVRAEKTVLADMLSEQNFPGEFLAVTVDLNRKMVLLTLNTEAKDFAKFVMERFTYAVRDVLKKARAR